MADESVQIKQEPLEQNYAAEMDDVDAVATCSSRVNIESSFDMSGSRACSQNEIIGTADLNPDIIIKEEPDFYDNNYAETVLGSVDAGDINFSCILKSSTSMPENVQIKAEPEDNFDYAAENFNSSENLPKYTNDASAEQKQLHNLSCHFQVLDEHENIITVTAADLPPDDGELALFEKLKPNLKPTEVKKSKNFVVCKLCMKRCTQDMNYAHHMEQHRRNRVFCIRKTCESWFSSLEECEAHEYGLHNITIFKCNVCNHKFHNFEQLCQHKVKMHSKLQRFICSMCRDWFISIQELHEHWASLLDRCGRIANLQEETPEQILKLLQERKPQTESRNSYKIKSASTAIPAGLKLKIKPLMDNSTSQGIINTSPNGIEIKKEPMDFETIIPDFSLKQNTESLNTNEVQIHKSSTTMNGLPIVPFKLRLRKFPLSLTTVESENDTFTTAILQNKRNSLGQALAQRITAKFSLKSVPKMFNLTNKLREDNLENKKAPVLTPESLKTLANGMRETKTNIAESDTNMNEIPSKILKLSTNFKIVKMSKEFQPNLVNLVTPNTSPQALNNNTHSDTPSALSTSDEQQDIPLKSSPDNGGRCFILKEVEVPPLDQTAAVAKLESITKTNTELSLSELLNEVLVNKNNNSDTNLEVKQVLEINAEDVKKEIENEMIEQQNDDSMSTATFSDCSLGSGSTSTATNTLIQNGGDLPKRQTQLSKRRNNRSKRKDRPEGYICPKCSRRYSTQSMVKEHLRNDCGRKPQNECDICHKCFFSTSTLNCHRTIHTGELPHKCNYCEKRFRTRGQVTVHHRTHTGERPFVCEICSQSFTHRETLISHLSRHIGMKRYKCYGCNKQFSCISGLSMHRSTRPETCGKIELNTRAIGPRVRVIRGRVVFEPQPTEPEDDAVDENSDNVSIGVPLNEVLTEIQNK